MTTKELAKIHSKNRAKLNRALTHHKLQMNETIKKEEEYKSSVNIRFYLILYVAWLETSLQYIIHNYDKQINEHLRSNILNSRSQIEMWDHLIRIKFREHYMGGKDKKFNIRNLGHTAFTRHEYINNLLINEVAAFIEIRNKLAHGQWAIALNNEGTAKVQSTTSKLWTLTKKDTLLAKNILSRFVILVDSLTASKISFEKCFDLQVEKLEKSLYQFNTKHEWIVLDMKRRYNSVSRVIKK